MRSAFTVRSRSSKCSQKYNKVNQQKKFHLLYLIYYGKMAIREAAEQVGINYLTAKTIVFFHKNNYKSYQFYLPSPLAPTATLTATYVHPRKLYALAEKQPRPKCQIEVICSIGQVLTSSVKANLPNTITQQKAYNYRPTETHEALSQNQNAFAQESVMPNLSPCPSINKNDLPNLATKLQGLDGPAENQSLSEEIDAWRYPQLTELKAF